MPVLKNQRHELFAQGLASGMTAQAAYEAAGFAPDPGKNAWRVKQRDDIRARIDELQTELQSATVAIQLSARSRLVDEFIRLAFMPIGETEFKPEHKLRAMEGLAKLESWIAAPAVPVTPGSAVVVNNFPGVNLSQASPETLEELRRMALESLRSQPGLLEGTPYKVAK